jgi:hypothetical protein
MTVPTVHLGGTSRELLLATRQIACERIRDALDALQDTQPNPRDFPRGGFDQALLSYQSRREWLCVVLSDLTTEAEAIDKQGRER